MLIELRISNFAVIERLTLECAAGFHVLTGETGAGKSILVDALALLVGGRASADQIRAGAEEAVVEAAFALPPAGALVEGLRADGLLGDGAGDLIIRRVVSRAGRHRVYVNGHLTPLHLLQNLAGTLVDIHGQHEQQSLLSPRAQLDALDAFGRLRDIRAGYSETYRSWQAGRQALEDAQRAAQDRRAREDLLRFQQRELEEAAVCPGEDEALAAERQRLSHSRRLAELADQAYERLYGGDRSVLGDLGSVGAVVKEIGAIDPGTAEWGALSEEAAVRLQELTARLRDYRNGLEQDPERLVQVEERLDRLHRLKKKYGGSLEALLAKAEEVHREVAALAQSEERVTELREGLDRDRAALEAAAQRLSDGRRRGAAKLEARIKDELAALRMERTTFQIAVQRESGDEALGPTGADRVEYLLSANPGEPLHPLARVASGGELSRVMLALKTVLAAGDQVPVLVFDEVDAGVGGAVAAAMGRRLKALAEYHQVFCVTHLPQIASQAATHYLVEKEVGKRRTSTRIRRLDAAGRREEIARMLAGLSVTDAARETAAELLGER